ncbi:hypothetical protein AB0D08_21295 [Kitasatospora sp. NPDC048540]|uniref:hypothetical protein n=1 Tax=unclassified Kitasatospora TaxID=2633591 RepID=UPI0011EA680D|nr:hypothetical protein [Kitasatospora sp. MBT63]
MQDMQLGKDLDAAPWTGVECHQWWHEVLAATTHWRTWTDDDEAIIRDFLEYGGKASEASISDLAGFLAGRQRGMGMYHWLQLAQMRSTTIHGLMNSDSRLSGLPTDEIWWKAACSAYRRPNGSDFHRSPDPDPPYSLEADAMTGGRMDDDSGSETEYLTLDDVEQRISKQEPVINCSISTGNGSLARSFRGDEIPFLMKTLAAVRRQMCSMIVEAGVSEGKVAFRREVEKSSRNSYFTATVSCSVQNPARSELTLSYRAEIILADEAFNSESRRVIAELKPGDSPLIGWLYVGLGIACIKGSRMSPYLGMLQLAAGTSGVAHDFQIRRMKKKGKLPGKSRSWLEVPYGFGPKNLRLLEGLLTLDIRLAPERDQDKIFDADYAKEHKNIKDMLKETTRVNRRVLAMAPKPTTMAVRQFQGLVIINEAFPDDSTEPPWDELRTILSVAPLGRIRINKENIELWGDGINAAAVGQALSDAGTKKQTVRSEAPLPPISDGYADPEKKSPGGTHQDVGSKDPAGSATEIAMDRQRRFSEAVLGDLKQFNALYKEALLSARKGIGSSEGGNPGPATLLGSLDKIYQSVDGIGSDSIRADITDRLNFIRNALTAASGHLRFCARMTSKISKIGHPAPGDGGFPPDLPREIENLLDQSLKRLAKAAGELTRAQSECDASTEIIGDYNGPHSPYRFALETSLMLIAGLGTDLTNTRRHIEIGQAGLAPLRGRVVAAAELARS